jgi:uncharacterized cysteine cluster protein YcgN (CxxCxxCC family)
MTRVACKLEDDSTCQCSLYPKRHNYVPECIVLTKTIEDNMYWLPQTLRRAVFEEKNVPLASAGVRRCAICA